jgi:hypothetical protein
MLTSVFFFALVVGLIVLFQSMVRTNGPAIRAALKGPRNLNSSAESPLGAIGMCLRASFSSEGQEALGDDLRRLILQLSAAPARSPAAAHRR